MTHLVFASLLAVAVATDVRAETCTMDNDFCVPFVGCAEDGTGFFYGVSFGKEQGPVYALSESGVRCQGNWWRNVFGAGKARFTCEDGRTGQASYTYFEKRSGTATGQGRTSAGKKVRFWAGRNAVAYVLHDPTETAEMMTCVVEAASRAKAPR